MVKHLTITVLNDNEPCLGLKNDWGWSVFLQSEKWNILFDANQDPEVIKYNSKKLGVDLTRTSFAVLSHFHADHYAGFEYIAKIKPKLNVYVPLDNNNFLKDWGLNTITVSQGLMLASDVWSSGSVKSNDSYNIAEQALGVKLDGKGLIVIVGCSHPGVDVLVEKLKVITKQDVFLVVGGFHKPSRNVLDNLALMVKHICPAHCSGSEAKNYVKAKYKEKYCLVKTGLKMRF